MTTAWEIDYDEGHDHGTVKSYIVGFLLSIVLTFAAFALVMENMLTGVAAYAALSTLAVVQLIIQVTFFLHLNTRPRMRWNVISFVFTVIVVGILVAGSLWIMYNMNYNMMDH